AAAIGCGLAKDTHALLVAAMILPLAWNALVRQKKYPDQGRYPVRLAAGISACLLAVLIFSQWSAGRTTVTDKPAYRAHPEISAFLDLCSGADLVGRWYLPYLNVLGKKILPNPEARGYFARRGFPLTPAVMARNGTYAGADNFAWHRDPELIAEVKPWIIARGRSVYFHYLARHWRATAAEVFAARNRLLLTVDPELRQHRWFRRPAGGAEAGPHLITAWMSVFFINNSAGLARFFVILALAGLAARKWPALRARWDNLPWISAYLVITGVAIIFTVYYCDIQDRGRHSLAYVVLMNVGVVWGYFLVIDRAVSALRQKRGRHHVTALARET
ncbi:MAG: hypothetical protein PHP98_11575, partial [Kiritimatiellae bacterium]|nr:hypothetical protein [Kiritimatiellia bacterium]